MKRLIMAVLALGLILFLLGCPPAQNPPPADTDQGNGAAVTNGTETPETNGDTGQEATNGDTGGNGEEADDGEDMDGNGDDDATDGADDGSGKSPAGSTG